MTDALPIYLPKETVSDDRYRLVELRISSGSKVRANQVFASFETSKALIEIAVPRDGYLHYRLKAGDQIQVGALVAVISTGEKISAAVFDSFAPSDTAVSPAGHVLASGTRISNGASELIRHHGINAEVFSHLELVKRSDVENYLANKGAQRATRALDAAEIIKNTSGDRIVVVGGGGHAKICIDILRQMNTFSIVGIVDSGLPLGVEVLGVPVIGIDANLLEFKKLGVQNAVNGVGAVTDHSKRGKIFRHLLELGFALPNLIHPSAVVEPSAKLGNGNHVMANATVGSAAMIGNNCIINSGTVVSHDCTLEDNVHIAPGAILAGTVHVGQDTLVGMGATVYFGVTIGSGAVINNGVNLARDIPAHSVVKR